MKERNRGTMIQFEQTCFTNAHPLSSYQSTVTLVPSAPGIPSKPSAPGPPCSGTPACSALPLRNYLAPSTNQARTHNISFVPFWTLFSPKPNSSLNTAESSTVRPFPTKAGLSLDWKTHIVTLGSLQALTSTRSLHTLREFEI